jgi:hypothetical protein
MTAPIACTLSPGDYRRRADELTALAAGSLRARERIDGGQRLVFSDSDQIAPQLRAVVAAEAGCCAFLQMELTRTADGLVLDITGPPDAQVVIAELLA